MNVSKALVVAATLAAMSISTALAQTSGTPAPATAAKDGAAQGGKLSSDSLMSEILDNPAAKAVLFKHLPDFEKSDQLDLTRTMTLRDIQQYSPDALTDAVLKAVDEDLAKIKPENGAGPGAKQPSK